MANMTSQLIGNGFSDDEKTAENLNQMYTTFHCRFTKKVFIKGEGFSNPLPESCCNIGYVDSDNIIDFDVPSATIMDKMKEKKAVMIGIPENRHAHGLETMLMTMKKGETSCFHVWWKPNHLPHPLGLGSTKQLNCSEEKLDLSEKEQFVLLVLYDFSDVVPIWQLISEQKYELSLQHKNNGTVFFKEDEVESAFYQYNLALKYIISIPMNAELDESQMEKHRQLKCICYLNLAACQIKYENFDSVIENCTKGLSLDAWNVKGLYRRALAYKNVGKIDQARSDLIKIIKKEPKNKTAGDLLESLMPSNIESNDTS